MTLKRFAADCLLLIYNRVRWILETDITSCFDEISHLWILANIPIDKQVLTQWINSEYIDKGTPYPTLRGTPQGSVISPVTMSMTLDSLEAVAKKSGSGLPRNRILFCFSAATCICVTNAEGCVPGTSKRNGEHVIRYADDFVITTKSKELLTTRVLPAVTSFLAQRGLTLSEEKTGIVYIERGFDFLGQNIRKYNGKRIIKPTRKAVRVLKGKRERETSYLTR